MTSKSVKKAHMWQTEAEVATCDVSSKDDVSKMILSHPLRETKSKKEIAKRDQIQKTKLNPKTYFYSCFSKFIN
jgi:hypothetical protein